MSITVNTFVKHMKKLCDHPLNYDEGVHYGNSDRAVKQVLFCWMPTVGAIHMAGKLGCELILGHESLYFPYDASVRSDNPPGWENWQINRQRRELLEKYNLVYLRGHGSLDDTGVTASFATLLDMPPPVWQEKWHQIHEIPQVSLRDLSVRVKNTMKMNGIRVAPAISMDTLVSRIGIAPGGASLFVNVDFMEPYIAHNCDCIIGADSDNYAMRFAVECGVSMIETSHECSELPCLHNAMKMFKLKFPNIGFHFYDNTCPFETV